MMEEDIFPSPAVAALLENHYTEARIHTDHKEKGAAQRALQTEMVGYVSAPYYVLVDPATGKKLAEFRLESATDSHEVLVDKFAAFLETGLRPQ